MNTHNPASYGDRIAESYDEIYKPLPDDHPMIEALAKLAGAGPALELGIGTGRVALPLASRGVPVHGIDASEEMVKQLHAKPGGSAIPVTIGDFTDFDIAGRFPLIYIVFNTFFALASQDDQIRCFAACAAHLDEGGAFVTETFYPDLTRFVRGQNVSAVRIDTDHVHLDVTLHDPVDQRLTAQHIHIGAGGLKMYPVQLRYAWPSEMDLMARISGLSLESRWGGWRGEPYTASGAAHVSIYRKPG